MSEKRNGYRSEVEELFEPFFKLHPTQDLTELFNPEDKCRQNVEISVTTRFEDHWVVESLDLYYRPNTDDIGGRYRVVVDYRLHGVTEVSEENKKKEREARRSYQVVLTSSGIRVADDVEVDDEMRKHIEDFKFLTQLFDLSEEGRSDFIFSDLNISESVSKQTKYRKYPAESQSYFLNYEVDKDHEMVRAVKDAFKIKTELEEERSINFSHTQVNEINPDSESLMFSTIHSIKMSFGDYEEVGRVVIRQTIGREDWKYE